MHKKTSNTNYLTVTATLFSVISGCATLNPINVNPESSWGIGGSNRVSSAGAVQLIDPGFEKIDLVSLLDPENINANSYEMCDEKSNGITSRSREIIDGCKIDIALHYFNSKKVMTQQTGTASVAMLDMRDEEKKCLKLKLNTTNLLKIRAILKNN
ncbi:hypothetical protein [Methylomonas sp. CM2]|uniref:hypothetical protein n=1 Tax=Methylomonas sp. CM2 TaxID=3417647 RepID=UPI003CEB6B97